MYVGGEEWTARSEKSIPAGSQVKVIGREGIGFDSCESRIGSFDVSINLNGGKMFDSNTFTLICLIGVVALLLMVFLASAIKIVPEYRRIVVFRLGRCIGAKGPGLGSADPVC